MGVDSTRDRNRVHPRVDAAHASFQQVETLGCPPERAAPRALDGAGRRAEPSNVPEPKTAAVDTERQDLEAEVLVVEDDEDEIVIICRAIRRHGVSSRFKIVRSGEEALDYLGSVREEGEPGAHRPKVILLDLQLSGIGGQEVLRKIRASGVLCTIPVVILSSSRSSEELCECYRLGANSFVSKPVKSDHPGEHILEIARYWVELNRVADVI